MKLEKREIIILAIAAVLVLYAIYAYFIAPPVKTPAGAGPAPAKTEKLAGEINADLSKSKISDFDKYVVKRSGTASRNNPFMSKDMFRKWDSKDDKKGKSDFIYSGYVDSRKGIIAIINGVEYRTGERLMKEGFILKHITPSKVLIFDKNSESSLEIPIQE